LKRLGLPEDTNLKSIWKGGMRGNSFDIFDVWYSVM
jgi:hypothetical protein